MDDRTKHLHAAIERAVERFHEERDMETDPARETATADQASAEDAGRVVVREVDERVLQDLASKYTDTLCPVHGTPPRFDVEGGAVREWFCCDALLQMVRELSKQDAA